MYENCLTSPMEIVDLIAYHGQSVPAYTGVCIHIRPKNPQECVAPFALYGMNTHPLHLWLCHPYSLLN